MKVLLINPSFNRYAGIKGHGGLSAPLNLACLAAYLREQRSDAKIEILDAEAYGLSYEETLNKVIAFDPDIIGITTTTPSFDIIVELINRIHNKLPKTPIILGGPHATGSPEECASTEGVTAVVLGEGELTLTEIYDAVKNNDTINRIKGICFRKENSVTFTGKRDLIKDLDSLPLPARDLLPMRLYYSPPTKSISEDRTANIISSRGCPFHCTYCLSDMMWDRKYRHRSPENVVAEIEHLINDYGIREFNFNDDLFTADKKRLSRFCELLIEKNLDIKWVCMSRADYIQPDILKLMKRAGCGKIAMGLESGSQQVLKAMNKRLDLSRSIEAVREIKKAGIKVGVSFVIGHIGETPDTIKETIRLAKMCNPDTVAFFQASPYPGTEFYRMAKEAGYFRPNLKWIDFAIVSDKISTVNLPGLPAEEIHRWVTKAYKSFYLSPHYILSRLKQIRSFHDIKNLLGGAAIFLKITAGSIFSANRKKKVVT
ncbi:MAG: B12-binding domain-containing radical SAM protein [Nitrospirae bacterium]|nr:B12-binding domain-containing radical SAM protein [Nitrospirota bacterium]MCL5978078.1 B12-binding domain-containing radical SAM protein [Nitrospirota bacterium]